MARAVPQTLLPDRLMAIPRSFQHRMPLLLGVFSCLIPISVRAASAASAATAAAFAFLVVARFCIFFSNCSIGAAADASAAASAAAAATFDHSDLTYALTASALRL